MKVGDIKRLPKIKGNGYFIVKVVGLNTHEGVQYAEVVPVDFNGDVREVNADRLLDLMTREEAQKTLKENLCAMCAYGSQNMDLCDIKSCDNKDAIKTLDQELCNDSVSRKELIKQIDILDNMYGSDFYWNVRKIVDSLPPVIPKGLTVTDFADKCRECGRQKTGKWIKYCMPRRGEQHFICTNCGKYVAYLEHHIKDLKYCPNCGSRNEVE